MDEHLGDRGELPASAVPEAPADMPVADELLVSQRPAMLALASLAVGAALAGRELLRRR